MLCIEREAGLISQMEVQSSETPMDKVTKGDYISIGFVEAIESFAS